MPHITIFIPGEGETAPLSGPTLLGGGSNTEETSIQLIKKACLKGNLPASGKIQTDWCGGRMRKPRRPNHIDRATWFANVEEPLLKHLPPNGKKLEISFNRFGFFISAKAE